MRHAHFLKGNLRSETIHSAIWCDTETRERRLSPRSVSHHLRFGWAAFQRRIRDRQWSDPEWRRFTTAAEFWAWVGSCTRPKTQTYVFAHNWSFDGPVLDVFREPQRQGWTLTRAVVEGPPVILTFKRGTATLKLLDTLNWWRVPLASLGRSIGVPKLKMPTGRPTRAQWDRYCRTDVEIIRRAVLTWLAFLESRDLGGFAPTLAGQAFRAFRHRYMDSPVLIDADPSALQLARESYHGGRSECFRLGRVEGPVHCLDVNSMYPAVMAETPLPAQLLRTFPTASVRELEAWTRTRCVVARVQLQTDEPAYPLVHAARLVFPIGRFTTTLTTPELTYALERGHVRACGPVAVYRSAVLFRRFVLDLYAERLQARARGDDVSVFLLKILLNSLYGKFGQHGKVWTEAGRAPDLEASVWDELDGETGTVYHWRKFGGLLQQLQAEPEARESSPAIASHVTAAARIALWGLILAAGRDNVWYVDTDSLYTSAEGLERLQGRVDASRLGGLKLEASYPWLEISGPKDYRGPTKAVHKGVKASATWVSSDTVEQDQWSGLRGLLRLGQPSAPVTSRVSKTLRRVYTKGTPTPSGSVEPLEMEG